MAHSPRTPPASASLEASAPSTVPDPVEPGRDRLPFRRVPGKEYGYHLGQVEEFMDRARTAYEQGQGLTARDVRHTVFDAVRGGYAAAEIDEVLDRLEDTLALAERDRDIASLGVHTWARSRRTEREVLLGRLDRSPGERFRRPSSASAASYDPAEVDALCDRISLALGLSPRPAGVQQGRRRPVAVDDVRRAVFEAAEGEPGYDEAQVDAYLDAVIEFMAAEDPSISG